MGDLNPTDFITGPDEIRRAVTGPRPEPIRTPEGGWTPGNIGPLVRHLARESRSILVQLPPEAMAEAERRNAEYERYAYGTPGMRL